MTSLRTRQRLVERLTEQGIKDVRILEVMRDTPRHIFLDEACSKKEKAKKILGLAWNGA